jgi:hypothetical protein
MMLFPPGSDAGRLSGSGIPSRWETKRSDARARCLVDADRADVAADLHLHRHQIARADALVASCLLVFTASYVLVRRRRGSDVLEASPAISGAGLAQGLSVVGILGGTLLSFDARQQGTTLSVAYLLDNLTAKTEWSQTRQNALWSAGISVAFFIAVGLLSLARLRSTPPATVAAVSR